MAHALTYGVTDRSQAGGPLGLALEELERRGYTVLDSGLSLEHLERLRGRLDAVARRQEQEAGGRQTLERINDADVVRCPLAYDEAFMELAVHPVLMEVSRRILGENFVLLMQNGVVNPPGHEHFQARWHRDLNYQHWVATQPLAIHALFCLDPFTEDTGGTVFLPGSHQIERFPSDAYVRKHETPVDAPPGAILIANAMTYHRAGHNRSDRTRRGVNHVIGRPFLAQQIDLPAMLQGRGRADPFLSRYLGYRWNPRPSVEAWRGERIEATGR